MSGCKHEHLDCINPYEFIRKYRCRDCGAVMMCSCDQDFGTRFLPHQIAHGTELRTHLKVPVTAGFQVGVCAKCRGLNEPASPKAPTYGRTSKVVRYYWREIFFETTRRFAAQTGSSSIEETVRQHELYEQVEREVIKEMQKLHEVTPKYTYKEESANDVLSSNAVEIIEVRAEHVPQQPRGVKLRRGAELFAPEDFAAHYFAERGYACFQTESIPFHVLFGVFTWMLITDFDDPLDDPAFLG